MITEAHTAQAFEQVQPYLFSVAYRMTGSATDAEDLVQDAWMRYLDAGRPDVTSLRAYLTTIVSRLSLDHLKSARHRREQTSGAWMPEPVATSVALGDPVATAEQRESVSMAFLTLLERLTPEQRVVYVLREGLGLPHDEIAEHIGKSSAACRQIYHRAQLRLADERRPTVAPDAEHRQLIERFLEAVQTGDVARIANVLTEDVILVGVGGPDRVAPQRPVVGIDKVSRGLAGFAKKGVRDLHRYTLELLDVNGAPALVFLEQGKVDRLFAFDVREGKIAGVRVLLDLGMLRHVQRSLRG